mgnify:CR=1 FL=1
MEMKHLFDTYNSQMLSQKSARYMHSELTTKEKNNKNQDVPEYSAIESVDISQDGKSCT